MPAFNGNGPLSVQVGPGTTIPLFNAEAVAAAENSIVIAPVDAGPVHRSAVTFQFQFAVSPTAVLTIMGSNFSPTSSGPQNGVVVYTSTSKLSDSYTDVNAFAFYWVNVTSYSAGGACSVVAHLM